MASSPFLVKDSSHPNNPATVSSDATWTAVMQDESLGNPVIQPQASGDGDLVVVYDSNIGSLTFSSAQNGNQGVFAEALGSDDFHNTAWAGDQLGSAVMLLSAGPPNTKIPLQGDQGILKTFGIDFSRFTESSPALTDFLNKLFPLNVTVHEQITPTSPLNALWCVATDTDEEIALTLSFDLDSSDALDTFNKAVTWVASELGITINPPSKPSSMPNIMLTLKKTTSYSLAGVKGSVANSFAFQFSLPNEFGGLACSIDFSTSATTLFLYPTVKPEPSIFSAIGQALGTTGLDGSQIPSGSADTFSSFFDDFDLWYLTVGKDTSVSPAMLSWRVALLASFKVNAIPILVSLTYRSDIGQFTGQLLLQSSLPDPTAQRLPGYDRRTGLPDSTLSRLGISLRQVPPSIDLWDLFGGQGADHGEPPNLPTQLTGARLTFQNISSTQSAFGIFVSIATVQKPTVGQTEAPSGFVWNGIDVLATIVKQNGQKTATDIVIQTSMTLNDKNNSKIPSAQLDMSLEYSSSTAGSDWILNGRVANLSMALLADYFDAGSQNGAMEVLGQLSLSSLEMNYTYEAGKQSTFLITASVELGKLELDLSYQYVSENHDPTKDTAAKQKWGNNPPPGVKILTGDDASSSETKKSLSKAVKATSKTEWAFEAYLHANAAGVDIAGIIDGIKPGAGHALPDFVGGIQVALDKDKSPVKLRYSGDDTGGSALTIWVEIGPFNLTFVQIRTASKNGTPTVKRLLRISVDQIPMLDHVPLVNQLPQPFDHLLYLWVEDPDQTDPNKSGFTKALIGDSSGTATASTVTVNSELSKLDIPVIQFHQADAKDGDLVLQAGHHFVIVAHGKVVLDHVFSTTSKVDKKAQNLHVKKITKRTQALGDDPTADEAPVTKGDTNTKAGPLTISALSLQYKNKSLLIGVDATLVLGPLEFAVDGFVLALDLSSVKLNDLSTIVQKNLISLSIHGLEAGVNKEPLTIKGAFVHDTDTSAIDGSKTESYRGGVAVGLKAWNLLAVGEYKIVTPKVGSQYKSVFIYGKLDGPLVELEFATISGVRVGFGFNSQVNLPTADQLYDFPFISDAAVSGAGDDPMKILDQLLKPSSGLPYVYAKEGSTWFCAGMTIACFDCIKLTAVLLFDIDTSGPHQGAIIALLADGIFQMEPDSPDPNLTLFYVELLIKVELNFIEGYIAADASLAPTSHVYVPQARLTGSGSFYSWFSPNSNAGDWVISIGGYHRAFTIPPHYPHPARLGLNFTVGDNIQVVGEGYAAVTPKCAMAGGTLHMSLGVGPVSAYCDVVLDVFINFKPFYFVAEISISVGVECDIDILFIHIHVSISLGADLELWGPDAFGGLAHVHFWFFGFDIRFGGSLSANSTGIPLPDFYDMVLKAGPVPTPPSSDQITANNPYIAQHKLSLEAGLFPSVPPVTGTAPPFPNTGAMTEWLVQAGTLQIRIDCGFALTSANVVVKEHAGGSKDLVPIPRDDGKSDPIPALFSFPMHNTVGLISTLELRIWDLDTTPNELQSGWRPVLVFKDGSKALWQQYDISLDPLFTPNPPSLSDGADPTITLCQAVRILPPPPKMGFSPIVDLDATAAMIFPVPDLNGVAYPPLPAQQTDYLSAPFETDKSGPTRWTDFSALLGGQGGNAVTAQGLNKAVIRGDAVKGPDSGLLGMCASALGWDLRPPADKSKGVVVSKSLDGRMEWELRGAPPAELVEELGNYYPDLPMVTVLG